MEYFYMYILFSIIFCARLHRGVWVSDMFSNGMYIYIVYGIYVFFIFCQNLTLVASNGKN